VPELQVQIAADDDAAAEVVRLGDRAHHPSGGGMSEPRQLADRLREYLAQREKDWGCEHTADFGEWCAACREQLTADIREAAHMLDVLALQEGR
jgi:hypothetical protein